VGAVRYRELSSTENEEELSLAVRARVEDARKLQGERFKARGFFTNARMEPADIRKFCRLDVNSSALLEHAMEAMRLSARGYARTLKVARTIADLGESKGVGREHLLEALQLRGPLGEDVNL